MEKQWVLNKDRRNKSLGLLLFYLLLAFWQAHSSPSAPVGFCVNDYITSSLFVCKLLLEHLIYY